MAEPRDGKPVEKITRPALPAVLFRLALVALAGAFAGLTFLVKTTPAFAADLRITQAIQSIDFPAFGLLMSLVSWPGFAPQAAIISALIILLIYGLGRRWEAAMALAAGGLSWVINVLVKDLVQRPRPAPDLVNVAATLKSYSFPSGHVMFYLGFFGFIAFLVFSLMKSSIKRSLLLAFLGGPIILVGFSRIFLGQHWASDVLGSYLLGSLVLIAVIQVYLWGKTRFFVHQA